MVPFRMRLALGPIYLLPRCSVFLGWRSGFRAFWRMWVEGRRRRRQMDELSAPWVVRAPCRRTFHVKHLVWPRVLADSHCVMLATSRVTCSSAPPRARRATIIERADALWSSPGTGGRLRELWTLVMCSSWSVRCMGRHDDPGGWCDAGVSGLKVRICARSASPWQCVVRSRWRLQRGVRSEACAARLASCAGVPPGAR